MFNGIIYKTGLIKYIKKESKFFLIGIKTNLKFKNKDVGSSVSCNGVCLTIFAIKKEVIFFYVSRESLSRSNLKFVKINDLINIEKSLIYGQEISGHYVQGHVDAMAKLKKISILDKTWIVFLEINKLFSKYLIEKGSISLNGVSLTISKVKKNQFEINIIPHTLKLTNLSKLKKDSYVNIEFDIFSKYLINLKR